MLSQHINVTCKIYDAFFTVFGNFGFDCDTAVVVLIGQVGDGAQN